MDFDPDNLEKGFEPGNEDWVPPQAPPPETRVVSRAEFLATIFSRVSLGFLLFVAFIAGAWVGGVALHDPDTCWLLATGRWIVENHQIPHIDPFSWTFAAEEAAGRHLVCYQWLSEVVFYLATLPVGLISLLLLCAVTITTAFFSIPMAWVVRRNAPFLKSSAVVILGMLAASFHTLARPEIFSYLFLALFLQNTHDARVSTLRGEKRIFPLVLILAPLMVLWANMHTGFVAGFAVLSALSLGAGLSMVLFKAPLRPLLQAGLVALGACLVSVCINPYGPGLYAYIPELFNSPINVHIVELEPVFKNFSTSPEFFPFLVLCLVFTALWLREALACRQAAKISGTLEKLLASELLLSLISGSVAIFNGLQHRRVACFVALIIVAEIIALLSLAKARTTPAVKAIALAETEVRASGEENAKANVEAEEDGEEAEAKADAAVLADAVARKDFWSILDAMTLDLWKAGGIFEMAIVALCAVAGVTLVAFRVSKPTLPQGSNAYQPPFAAIEFIKNHPQQGNLFNGPHGGDMLIYNLPATVKGNPRVFIDTRFDMYGYNIDHEYMVINDGEPGWEDLLKKRDINWVFVNVKSALAENLKKDERWMILYEDKDAIVMRRRAADGSEDSHF